MGFFSIACRLIAQQSKLIVNIKCYEANQLLIDSIQKNLALYGIGGSVTHSAIGAQNGVMKFSFRKDGMIGGTLNNTLSKNDGDEMIFTESPVSSLEYIINDSEQCGIVKIDIEGHETDAFKSIENNRNALNNIFIIEFSPWQMNRLLSGGSTYGQWLLDNFCIFNIGNWLYRSAIDKITDINGLSDCLNTDKKPHNTDLLLVPNDNYAIIDAVERFEL
jgi:FkbM family methyltransferase